MHGTPLSRLRRRLTGVHFGQYSAGGCSFVFTLLQEGRLVLAPPRTSSIAQRRIHPALLASHWNCCACSSAALSRGSELSRQT